MFQFIDPYYVGLGGWAGDRYSYAGSCASPLNTPLGGWGIDTVTRVAVPHLNKPLSMHAITNYALDTFFQRL